MIASSRFVKTVAAAAALVLHGTVVAAVFQGEAIEIEGDAGGVEASIGNSFADMAAGMMTPDATDEVVEETPPEEVSAQDTPEEAVQERPEDTLSEVEPQEAAEPVEQAETAPVTPTETPAENVPDPVEQAEITPNVPLVPVTPSETVPEESVQAAEPQPSEMLEPVDEAPSAVTRSLRPKPRSAEFEEAHKPEPPKPQRTTQSQPKAQPKGNAQQNARAGSATGSQSQTRSAAQGSGQSQAAGNAAASNYPGQVMRKISRVPRPRVGSRGTAVVAFRIGGNGGLAGVSIARSSGSSALDRAAVRMIQRAAPFPPPPAGARTSFSINIKGS